MREINAQIAAINKQIGDLNSTLKQFQISKTILATLS
jgi:prefoldin subunit 5